MANWKKRFIEKAFEIASWSKDRNRHVGAIITTEGNRIVAQGYNGFPSGCDDDVDERHERPAKYLFSEHAERNAIYNACRLGVSVEDCKIYITDYPCADCARGIIQSGIKHVIAPKPDFSHERWGGSWKASEEMFLETGVKVEYYDRDDFVPSSEMGGATAPRCECSKD